jgi:hypothetical protein
MIKEWQRVEDIYLQDFFKVYAVKSMSHRLANHQDEILDGFNSSVKSSASRTRARFVTKRGLKYTKEEAEELGDKASDWRTYRIPAKDRRSVTIRYYMYNLIKHVRSVASFQNTVQRMVHWNRDTLDFLESFGIEKVKMNSFFDCSVLSEQTHELNRSFYEFTEDAILDVICLCAQSLRLQKPFQDHPANKSQVLPEECFDRYCRVPKVLGKQERQALQCQFSNAPDCVPADRRKKSVRHPAAKGDGSSNSRPGTSDQKQTGSDKDEKRTGSRLVVPSVDIDDVWKRFSPRVMEKEVDVHDDVEILLPPSTPELAV